MGIIRGDGGAPRSTISRAIDDFCNAEAAQTSLEYRRAYFHLGNFLLNISASAWEWETTVVLINAVLAPLINSFALLSTKKS